MNGHLFSRSACHLTLFGAAVLAAPTLASSHREAPYVTEHPKLDSTDFYMFRSYEPGREGYVTLIANYIPFQTPYGGPNFFTMDPEARYEVHIDNNGDAVEDMTFRFRFTNTLRALRVDVDGVSQPVPLFNIGGIGPGITTGGGLNIVENYTIDLVRGDRDTGVAQRLFRAGSNSLVFNKPADRIGDKSIPEYENYARAHIFEFIIPGCAQRGRVFVGQRKDPFVVNLGEVFDLVNLNPVGPENGSCDTLEEENCTSIVIELPIACVLGPSGDPVIGAWTSASLPRTRQLLAQPTFQSPSTETGPFQQVSRLSQPLVNELVIGLPDKDRFSASEPKDDGQFLSYVTHPTLPALLEILFPIVQAPCTPRGDLVAVFLTGVPGLNQPMSVTPGEMMRLNTSIDAQPAGMQSRLGVLGGDIAGFPNGRRPGDDVVDIELRAAMGALLDATCAPSGALPYTDGAFVDDSFFDTAFPYLRTPVAASPNECEVPTPMASK